MRIKHWQIFLFLPFKRLTIFAVISIFVISIVKRIYFITITLSVTNYFYFDILDSIMIFLLFAPALKPACRQAEVQVNFSAFSPACRQAGFRVWGKKAEKSDR
jgi:hypothetical protein